MPVLIWSVDSDSIGSIVRTGRRFALSAEEFRSDAEELDRALDDLLDEAWHALNIITRRNNGEARFDAFEQRWVLGRAVYVSEILRHEALLGEERFLLWQALTPKAWHGVRHDTSREPRWRDLIPTRYRSWQSNPKDRDAYEFLKIGYWLREQQLQDAGELFGWKSSNAQDLYKRSGLHSFELRQAVLYWLRRQSPQIREALAKAKSKGRRNFAEIPYALSKRFPSSGPGSALMPQHYPEDELRGIVCKVLDEARDARFG